MDQTYFCTILSECEVKGRSLPVPQFMMAEQKRLKRKRSMRSPRYHSGFDEIILEREAKGSSSSESSSSSSEVTFIISFYFYLFIYSFYKFCHYFQMWRSRDATENQMVYIAAKL